MADSSAMTVDFLRARLLSERSVSRASRERADELAKRVTELEEQVREVTAQRRQAERAAAEVLAILESQGFGAHLSDLTDDSDSDQEEDGDAKSRGDDAARAAGEDEEEPEPSAAAAKGEAAEDALSGTARPGGLSWKGRCVSPRKARQLRQHRRSYLHLLSSSSDSSSPKYRVGQSCRKNKRRVELSNGSSRSAAPEGDGGGTGSRNGGQDGSDLTDDGQADMDGEVGGDARSSGGAGGGGGHYVIRYEKDGEMERVLERQAELIGQYEEEEKAQREWEKQYNENRNANKGDVEVKTKAYETDAECKSSDKYLHRTSNPSVAERLPIGLLSESPQNGVQPCETNNEADHGSPETSSISAQENSNTSTVTRQDQEPGDQTSDADSGYNAIARSPKRDAAKAPAPSDGSPSSETLNSKVSDWSSSQFHDFTDSQLDTQSHRPAPSSSMDIESVLQALQRARISLSAKLSKPVPPSQVTLALPAPGDEYKEYDDDDLAADDREDSYGEKLSSSSPARARQEILALPAPEDYHEGQDLPLDDAAISHAERGSSSGDAREEILALPAPGDDYRKEIEEYTKIPVGAPGLFRLPTDSFPVDEKLFAGAAARHATSILSNPSYGAPTSAPSISGDGSGTGFSAKQASVLLTVPTTLGRCSSIPGPDFAVGSSPFLSGIPGLDDLRRARPLGDADLFMQRGIDYTISNKWMV